MSESKPILKRSPQEIIAYIETWKTSGLNKKKFCERENINYLTFIGWTKGKNQKATKLWEKFIPLQINPSSVGLFAEVHLGSNRKIIFHQPISLEFFQAVLKC